jgi:hypothetical protein
MVPADDAGALAGALIEAIKRPPDPARLIARANEFSLDACIDRYEAMLATIMGERSAAVALA